MKTLILTIALILLTMVVSAQLTIVNNTEYNLTQLTKQYCKELQLDSMNIHINTHNGLIYDKYKAVTYGQNGTYIIRLSNELLIEDRKKALAHELVHIKQLSSKELIYVDRHIIYNGKEYRANENNHSNDKHEIQASVTADKLYQTIKPNYYENNN